MVILNLKRQLSLALALILSVFLLFSPLLDVYGEHNHSCSPAECSLCITANALSVLCKVTLITLLTYAVLPAHLRLYDELRKSARLPLYESPVVLKTEILS